jgi:hypothetical protein
VGTVIGMKNTQTWATPTFYRVIVGGFALLGAARWITYAAFPRSRSWDHLVFCIAFSAMAMVLAIVYRRRGWI